MINEMARRAGVFVLGAACLGQSYYIHARSASPSAAREAAEQPRHLASDAEEMKKGLTPEQRREADALQGQAFEEWYQARAAVSGIRTDIQVTDKEVIVTFRVPGLQSESLKIAVSDVLIRANYSARSVVEGRGAGGAYRGEAVRQFETIMPVPTNADAKKHRFLPAGEGFKIIFEKLEDPSLKS